VVVMSEKYFTGCKQFVTTRTILSRALDMVNSVGSQTESANECDNRQARKAETPECQ